MYPLNHTPVFYEFLNRFLKKAGSKHNIKQSNKLFLYDKCNCGESSCHSFFLLSKRKINEGFYLYHTILTNKGEFGIGLYDDGQFLFVATGNNHLPFKNEYKSCFRSESSINKRLRTTHKRHKITAKDRQKLNKFFAELRIESPYKIEETIDSCLRYYL